MKEIIVGLMAVMFGLVALAGPAQATGGGGNPPAEPETDARFRRGAAG